jgi:phage baseplate assembly protein V
MTQAGKNFGLCVGIVSDRRDPKGLGRVKFTRPTHADRESDWTRVAALYGGAERGAHWVPEKGDEVLVGHLDGDPKVAVILGSLYSTQQKPPSNDPDQRVFKSKKGHTITISDADGSEKVELATSGGQKVTLTESGGTVTISATSKIVLDAPSIELGGSGASLKALLGDAFLKAFTLHVHPVPSLETSGPPTPPVIDATVLSSITKLKG